MIKHKILLDKVKYSNKPDKKEIGGINNRIIKNPVEITLEELSKLVTQPNGQTWMPGYIQGKRSNANWKYQSLFALDFDSGITFLEVLTRLKEFGIDCNFAYTTFSNSDKFPKFRVIFQLNAVIIDKSIRDKIQLALMELFPEVDKSCKDASRIFFGGKEIIYKNYEYYLDLNTLLMGATTYATKNTNTKHLSQKLNRINKKIGDIQECVKNGNHYKINIDNSRNHTKNKKTNKELIKVDWETLKAKLKILNDFANGEWLYHKELFGLATNLIHIHGGTKFFKECLDKNLNYTQDKFNLPSIAKYYNYLPTKLENFSNYKEDWVYSTLLQAARVNEVIRINPYKTISLSTAEKEYNQLFQETVKQKNNKVTVFKVATGLGKTKSIEEIEKAVIACPTHQLKQEVSHRMKINCKITPKLPENIPKNLKNKLDNLYKVGATTEANKVIKEASEHINELKLYRNQLINVFESSDTVLTTHDKALFVDFPHLETVIFDEDPISKLLSVGKININDLLKLKKHIKNKGDVITIEKFINELENGKTNCPLKMDTIIFNDYKQVEEAIINHNNDYEGNLINFFNSNFYAVDSHNASVIYYINKNTLPENKKIIILSATADETFYKRLFGDRLEFYDLSNVELQGTLVQDTNYSFSRTSLNNDNCLEYALDKTKDYDAVVTFASYKNSFPNSVTNMHLGNVLGYDELKGKKVAVVGTPYHNHLMYALFAACLDLDYKTSDFQMSNQTIERNGIQFNLKTYAHKGLRNIHLSLMESELRQAVGRARLLRESEGKVLLLSKLPLPEACINEEEVNQSVCS